MKKFIKSAMPLSALILTITLTATSCGKKGSDPEASIPGNNNLVNTSSPGTVNPTPSNNNTGGTGNNSNPQPTSPTGVTYSDSSCPRNASRGVYTRTLYNTGRGAIETADDFFIDGFKPEQKLRVQIKAGGANTSANSGAAQSYDEIKYFVSLIADGFEISSEKTAPGSYTVPTSSPAKWCTYNKPNGPNKGMCVGDVSSILYFDNVLSPSYNTYKLKIRAFTDAKCKTYCNYSNPNFYQYYWGYGYLFDNNLYTKCIQDHCNVGDINETAVWSVNVAVEVDNTQCLSNPAPYFDQAITQ